MSEKPVSMPDSNPPPTTPQPERARQSDRVRAMKYKQMLASVKRVRSMSSGGRIFLRFNQLDILEHWILLINFAILSVTGMLEIFSNNRISADFITPVFRNLDNLRGLHNVAALFYVGMVVFHLGYSGVKWFVKNEPPLLVPSKQDWADFLHTWKYLLRRSFPRPQFGRFTIDQKVTYWMVLSFSILMVITSLAQWFQTWVAQYMTDAILPISRSLHNLTGLLIIVTFLPWHIYHTVIKERNASIFTGVLDEKTIRHNHPLEYRQIMAAVDEFQAQSEADAATEAQTITAQESAPQTAEPAVVAVDEKPAAK